MDKLLLVLIALCAKNVCCLFTSGKDYIYAYNATSSAGVILPLSASSSWGLQGKLVIQARERMVVMQLQSLTMSMRNGKIDWQKEMNINVKEMVEPFEIRFDNGLVRNISIQSEPVWVTNIKRSIASIFQLDLLNLERHTAFYSTEVNHYGQCNIEYTVSFENNGEKLVRKFFDPRNCTGHPEHTWANVPSVQCPNKEQNPILKLSERRYRIKSNETTPQILSVNTSGGVYVQPFQSYGEAQFHFTEQSFNLISVQNTTHAISVNGSHAINPRHDLPHSDLTQGQGIPDKGTIFLTIKKLLDSLSENLESSNLETEINNLHNVTTSVLLYYLGMLDRAELQNAYNQISRTSYNEKTIRNIFIEALPHVGSQDAALFILNLIKDKMVTDITAVHLLTQLPLHIRDPDVGLLDDLQPLLNLSGQISVEVQNTAILTYGTLIYKTCNIHCTYETLDNYIHLYLDKFAEAKQYENKVIWLQGLANIQLGRVTEFLEAIVSGVNAELRHFRELAAWASLPMAASRASHIYPVYWPILTNRTEHLEMRIAALTLLLVSSSTPDRLISLYWHMQTESCQHLYNYFYTTVKSMTHTTHPCYVQMSGIAALFRRVLRKPLSNTNLMSANYMFDYQDTYKKFGGMLNGIIAANPLTNIPEVAHLTINNYGSGIDMNHISLYVKAKGLLHSLSTYLGNSTHIKDLLQQFKLDKKRGDVTVHLEIIIQVQHKTVLCICLNQTDIANAFKYLSSLSDNVYHIYRNMEFHVNQQRMHIPLTMESVQATDLGTNVRLAITVTSLFSIRGNFTHTPSGRNNHLILRVSMHGTDIIENYNPFVDLWHAVEKSQSLHGYLPINITMGLKERFFVSYETPTEYLKTGFIAHVRTTTDIRGAKLFRKLKEICPMCPASYTVGKSPPHHESKNTYLFNTILAELGGQVFVKVYNCEESASQRELIADMVSSHQANSQGYPAIQALLIGIHFLNYFSYVPPKGNCGLAVYVESSNSQRTQVKLEYVKNGMHHMFALVHSDLKSRRILRQWSMVALYEATSWMSDILKIKLTRVAPSETIIKFCFEAERDIPWEWDFLSIKPSDTAQLKLNAVWGLSDTVKGKCVGSSVQLHLLGKVSSDQIEESKKSHWPYSKCREELGGKIFVPYTHACYETSRELSTLRKYQIFCQYQDLPDRLSKLIWKFRALYDLVDGNSTYAAQTDQFLLNVVFPKESSSGEMQINENKFTIEYDAEFVDHFLMRTRIHKYTDIPFLNTFFSTCTIIPGSVRSSYNVSLPFSVKKEVLLLGQCYDDNPRFAIIAENVLNTVAISLIDETGTTKIMAYESGGAVYNSTMYVPLERNFVFHALGPIRVRMDETSVDLLFPTLFLFIHWTQEQILLFFPNYLLESSCGICLAVASSTNSLYEKLQ